MPSQTLSSPCSHASAVSPTCTALQAHRHLRLPHRSEHIATAVYCMFLLTQMRLAVDGTVSAIHSRFARVLAGKSGVDGRDCIIQSRTCTLTCPSGEVTRLGAAGPTTAMPRRASSCCASAGISLPAGAWTCAHQTHRGTVEMQPQEQGLSGDTAIGAARLAPTLSCLYKPAVARGGRNRQACEPRQY